MQYFLRRKEAQHGTILAGRVLHGKKNTGQFSLLQLPYWMAWHMTQWRKANGRSAKYGMTKQGRWQQTVYYTNYSTQMKHSIVSNFSILLDLSRMPYGATESETTAPSTLPQTPRSTDFEGFHSFIGTLLELGFWYVP